MTDAIRGVSTEYHPLDNAHLEQASRGESRVSKTALTRQIATNIKNTLQDLQSPKAKMMPDYQAQLRGRLEEALHQLDAVRQGMDHRKNKVRFVDVISFGITKAVRVMRHKALNRQITTLKGQLDVQLMQLRDESARVNKTDRPASELGPPRTLIRAHNGRTYELLNKLTLAEAEKMGFIEKRGDAYVLTGGHEAEGGKVVEFVGDPQSPTAVRIKLGKGGIGTVRLAREVNSETHVPLDPESIFAVKKTLEWDTALLDQIPFKADVQGRNDAVITSGHRGEDKLYEFMPYLVGQNGRSFMESLWEHPELSEPVPHLRGQLLTRIAQSAIDQVAFFHDRGFAHRDLKPDNMLINFRTGEVSLIDFDTATKKPNTDEVMGTVAYMAPEVLLAQFQGGYDPKKADAYSLGIVLTEMVLGHHPSTNFVLPSPLTLGAIEKFHAYIGKAILALPADTPLRDVIVGLTHQDPDQRMSVHEAKTVVASIEVPADFLIALAKFKATEVLC
ncbi:MAG: protein kinase [Candidatus Margulisiibacteriota bacterium]